MPASTQAITFAKRYSLLRVASILAYFSICLQGMFIGLPWGLILIVGLFEGEALSRITILFADVALLGLFFLPAGKRNKQTLCVEVIVYFLLWLPLAERLAAVPIRLFNYALFVVPATCFAVLYPLSVFFSCKIFRSKERIATANIAVAKE